MIVKEIINGFVTTMAVVTSIIPTKTVIVTRGIWTNQAQVVNISSDKTISLKKILNDSCTTETTKKDVCKLFPKHHIINTFMDKTLPLFDLLHGIYCA